MTKRHKKCGNCGGYGVPARSPRRKCPFCGAVTLTKRYNTPAWLRRPDPCVKPNPDAQFRDSERGRRIAGKLQKAVACKRCYALLVKRRKTDMRMLVRVGECPRCFAALLDKILHECLLAALAVQAGTSERKKVTLE